jgi:hypothetical protein
VAQAPSGLTVDLRSRALEAYDGDPRTRIALRLVILVTLSLKSERTRLAMVVACIFSSGQTVHAIGDWTTVLLESAALLRSVFCF